MSIADFSAAVPIAYAEMGGMPVADYPHVQKWASRIFALPAWRSTAPEQIRSAA